MVRRRPAAALSLCPSVKHRWGSQAPWSLGCSDAPVVAVAIVRGCCAGVGPARLLFHAVVWVMHWRLNAAAFCCLFYGSGGHHLCRTRAFETFECVVDDRLLPSGQLAGHTIDDLAVLRRVMWPTGRTKGAGLTRPHQPDDWCWHRRQEGRDTRWVAGLL